MKGNFSILHLSDLHIFAKKSGEYSSKDLSLLIDDVSEQLRNSHVTHLIVVVSGDIIDRGDYKNNGAAIKFFDDLYKKLATDNDISIVDIQIVPGNHDRELSSVIKMCSIASKQNGLDDSKEWQIYKDNSIEFLKMVNAIYDIYGKKNIDRTFGCERISINDSKVCLIRMDSAWCACDSKTDKRNIRFGKYQISELYEEYQEVIEKDDVDVTIAISHHPLSWIYPEEEELIRDYMMKEKFMNVNLLLSGHVHEQSVENLYNHEHSLISLVTGIGWGEKRPSEISEHRYSIYTINALRNCCEIKVRKTKSTGKNGFIDDYSIYTEGEIINKRIFFPVNMTGSYPIIPINSTDADNLSGIYLDEKIMEKLISVMNDNNEFRTKCQRTFLRYQRAYLENWYNSEENQNIESGIKNFPDFDQKLSGFPISNEEKWELFTGYISELCQNAAEIFSKSFTKGAILRIHFRHLTIKDKSISYPKMIAWIAKNGKCESYSDNMQNIGWDGLIRAAYKSNKSLVYSANEWKNPITTVWEDFLTLTVHSIKYTNREEKYGQKGEYPVLSYGISYKNSEDIWNDSLILYLMSYLKIEQQLSSLIDNFIDYFGIDLSVVINKLVNV